GERPRPLGQQRRCRLFRFGCFRYPDGIGPPRNRAGEPRGPPTTMQQVLFHIPYIGLPIYGFGAMLVVALFLCTWLAGRRAEKEGVAKEHIQDLAFWIVIAGILGARVVFMIQFGVPWWKFLNVWEGGLVFYGALAGGVVGYLLGYRYILRR